MAPVDTTTFLKIGEIAKAAGVTPQTIRSWERKGLLTSQRTAGGQRLFDPQEVERVRTINARRRRTEWQDALQDRPKQGASASEDQAGLGARVRKFRLERGLTIQELAEKSGISRSLISSIERGEARGTYRTLTLLASALGIAMSHMADNPPTPPQVYRHGAQPSTLVGQGILITELAAPGHPFEPALVVVPGGSGSGGRYSSAGTVFLYLLSGALSISSSEHPEDTRLEPGDACTIGAGSEWTWHNPDGGDARLLWVEHLPEHRPE